jgi:hypothetical protein
MLSKIKEKEKAINLRRQGFSYSEILKEVFVAKSSLSLWLQSVGLSKKQKQRLTEKKLAAMKRGWESRHRKRVLITQEIKSKAKNEINSLTEKELWLIGIALYWGEGHKEKDYRPGTGVQFSNSDPRMIELFLKWLLGIVKIPKEKIYFEIYIHESHKNNINKVIDYWLNHTSFSRDNFRHIYFKKNKINTKRKNIGKFYYGLLRIRVGESSELNRKIQGWIDGICKNCGVV